MASHGIQTEGERELDELRPSQLSGLIDAALSELDVDDRSGPLLSASGMSMLIEITDVDLDVWIEAVSDSPQHHLRWSFGEPDSEPKLTLRMDAKTANAYLQGRESLAIGIARGRVRCSGESRIALLYLPLLRLLVGPYRRAVRESAPALAI